MRKILASGVVVAGLAYKYQEGLAYLWQLASDWLLVGLCVAGVVILLLAMVARGRQVRQDRQMQAEYARKQPRLQAPQQPQVLMLPPGYGMPGAQAQGTPKATYTQLPIERYELL